MMAGSVSGSLSTQEWVPPLTVTSVPEDRRAASVDGLLLERVVEVWEDPTHPVDPEDQGDDDDPQGDKTPGDRAPRLPRRLVLWRL